MWILIQVVIHSFYSTWPGVERNWIILSGVEWKFEHNRAKLNEIEETCVNLNEIWMKFEWILIQLNEHWMYLNNIEIWVDLSEFEWNRMKFEWLSLNFTQIHSILFNFSPQFTQIYSMSLNIGPTWVRQVTGHLNDCTHDDLYDTWP